MKATDDQLTFRAWLVKQLTLTRWSGTLDMSLDDLAVCLGVQVAVLREAQALRDGELKKRGNAGVTRGRRRFIGHDYADVEVRMPRSIHAAWREFCKSRQVEPGTVFRSIIHHFLLAPSRPTNTTSKWIFRGKLVTIDWMNKAEVGFKARARIPRGAQIALDTHADRWNTEPAAILRGLLTDFLEGKILRMKMVAFSELWGDPDRYLHPEKFK